MRRSEMVSRGVGYLIDQEKMRNIKINLNKKELVDYLLACFERQGMLPPEVLPLPQSVIDNCESGNYWENENEA